MCGVLFSMDDWRSAMEMVSYYQKGEDGKSEVKPLQNILNRSVDELIGKKIKGINFTMGTYGMGGPGFVGLLLEDSKSNQEWMVFTIWAAADSLLLNDKWVGAHPMFYDQQKPLYSNILSKGEVLEWDNVSPEIIGGAILKADLKNKSFTININLNGKIHKLELLDEDPRLSPMPSGEKRKALKDGDQMGKYIVFHEIGGMLDTVENRKR